MLKISHLGAIVTGMIVSFLVGFFICYGFVTKVPKSNKEQIPDEIAESKQFEESLDLVVNYDDPISDAIVAGGYNRKFHQDVNEQTFPKKEFEKGQKGLVVKLLRPSNAGYRRSIADMIKEGYRSATFRELIAFGKKYPKAQTHFFIVALNCDYGRSHSPELQYFPFLWHRVEVLQISPLVSYEFLDKNGNSDSEIRYLGVKEKAD
ncbi:MAG: hypothetical protein EXS48_01085 [Candidatus Staskawiczbacteria bacterium]|nr:hypothetical protein [Candidatus Staskawiczbacteria bacterium]